MQSRNGAAHAEALERKLLAFCREQALFSPGEHVLAAVSGGADSMALLALLEALREPLAITLGAVHFHHGLRGDEADRDADFVRSWCEGRGIECIVGRGDVSARAAQTGESIETAARTLRYAFFERCAADKLATAHTANDNLETVLLHLLRGCGTRGFAGIPPRRGRIVRPMLEFTREEVLAYLQARAIPHREDASNAADDCLRNRLRHRVIPLLEAENPRLYETLRRSTRLVREEDACLSALAGEAARRCRTEDGWSCEALRALQPALRRRVLLSLLQQLPLSAPRSCYVEALEHLLDSGRPSARCALPEGWIARREYGNIRLVREELPVKWAPRRLTIPGDTEISEIGWKIRAVVTESSSISQKNLNTFALRYDMIAADGWRVRPRQTGDTLLLASGHRTLKRLMIDRRMPAHLRDRCPVVVCGGQIAAVPGLACSAAFAPQPGLPVLVLTLEALSPADPDANTQ